MVLRPPEPTGPGAAYDADFHIEQCKIVYTTAAMTGDCLMPLSNSSCLVL